MLILARVVQGIGGGVLPFLWITWLGVRYRIKSTTHDVPVEALFVEEEAVAVTRAAEEAEVAQGHPSRYGSDRRRGTTDGEQGSP